MVRRLGFSIGCLAVALAGKARADAPAKLSPWDQGEARPFVAGRFDLGVLFARPALMLGYGKPHWEWFGVEAYALTTNSFFATYAGTRASLPFLDFTMGLRDTWAYRRSLLARKARYDASDVSSAAHGHARYLAIDYELTGVLPVPAGYALFGVLATTVLDVPADEDVYDEGMRVVMRPPGAIDFRLGYLVAMGRGNAIKLGALTETIPLPGRGATVERVGPIASVALTDHLEGIFVFTAVVTSPDTLGLWHAPYGFAGVRYRWAMGDERPRFP